MENWFKFWGMYPKKMCLKRTKLIWEKLTEEQKQKALDAIPNHVKFWQMQQWEHRYIPMPFTWLDGERWEDELDIPAALLTSPSNVLAFAKQRKIEALPGESMEAFTQRLRMTR